MRREAAVIESKIDYDLWCNHIAHHLLQCATPFDPSYIGTAFEDVQGANAHAQKHHSQQSQQNTNIDINININTNTQFSIIESNANEQMLLNCNPLYKDLMKNDNIITRQHCFFSTLASVFSKFVVHDTSKKNKSKRFKNEQQLTFVKKIYIIATINLQYFLHS
ncbi:hypothetical protein RFI_29978 [Reticulomyxa filosa]|uniref:Uncharacterized protein n=1 Tax=Reticulomyxa filosa TaxID=46433 RepID=X6M0N6_RETFI|nr:hypothetical protein RFI_29978 [Reticulomyxa filosa]|eukprot:ETO07414.1 hypothetical protein RFI_29978 [Reticulomyxa filosa]